MPNLVAGAGNVNTNEVGPRAPWRGRSRPAVPPSRLAI
jgi:hypothetical protein